MHSSTAFHTYSSMTSKPIYIVLYTVPSLRKGDYASAKEKASGRTAAEEV